MPIQATTQAPVPVKPITMNFQAEITKYGSPTADESKMPQLSQEEEKCTYHPGHYHQPANSLLRPREQCDSQRPSCQRCLISGQSCEGYQQGLNFIVYTKSEENDTAPLGPVAAPPPSNFGNASAYAVGLWWQLRTLYLPSPVGFRDGTHSAWFDAAIALSSINRMSQTAGLSLCMRVLGQKTGDRAIACDGLRLYGQSLAMLQRSICTREQHQSLAAKRALLLTCMFMQVTDVALIGTRLTVGTPDWKPDDWLAHTKGLEACMKAIGPAGFQQKPLHTLFAWCRTVLVRILTVCRSLSASLTSVPAAFFHIY